MSNYTHTGIRISIGVILLFCLLLTINVWGAVITVGPSGCNYTTIQGAINNASTGDTIEVMSATYPESLVVDRSVTITGIDTGAGNPNLDFMGGNVGINISASGVTVERFSLGNASRNAVYISNNNATIHGCNISHFPVHDFNYTAINAIFVSNTTVSGNTITCDMGISFYNCTRVTVEDNWIDNYAGYTVKIYHEDQHEYVHYPGHVIRNNTIRAKECYAIIVNADNDWSIVDDAIIERNTIYNSWYPLIMSAPSSGVVISNNTLYNHPDEPYHESHIGVYVYGADNCTVKDHAIEGFNSNTIIRLDSCSRALVTGNNINNNSYIGMYLSGLTNSNITGNTMEGNQYQFGFEGTPADLPGNTLDETNLVNGKPVIYREGIDGITIDSLMNPGTVYLIGCDDAVIRDLAISDEMYGIALIQSDNGLVTNNTVTGSLSGIAVYLNQGTSIEGNTLNQCSTGLDMGSLGDSRIHDNTIASAGSGGISLQGAFDSTYVEENTITDAGEVGIITSGVDGNSFEIRNNVVENSLIAGIALEESHWVNVSNNHIRNIQMDSSAGIELGITDDSLISGNIIEDPTLGFRILGSSDNLFTDNTAGPAELGIGLYTTYKLRTPVISTDNTFSNNLVNATVAVNGTITRNQSIAGPVATPQHPWGSQQGDLVKKYPGYEIEPIVQQSIRHTFSSSSQDLISSGISPNYWNVTVTTGPNIVGGPYIGGNYWADPDGTGWSQITPDRGDGFCNAPFAIDANNTDYLPLHLNTSSSNVGVFRGGVFYRNGATDIVYGLPTDTPVIGDWNGDLKSEVGVWRGGVFYRKDATDIVYGLPTDTPVIGDWNGDLKSEVGVFRGGVFYRNGATDIVYGLSTDTPVIGDWNGDGMSEVGVFRDGVFYRNGADAIVFGLSTDTPVIGDWNGDGISEVGVFRGGIFYRNGATTIGYGLPTDTPVIGKWT